MTQEVSILMVGINHKTANVDLREKLAFTGEQVKEFLIKNKNHEEFRELVLLSTCNRIELYAVCYHHDDSLVSKLIDLIWQFHHLEPLELTPHIYSEKGVAVLRHLIKVASGINSMVFGETEILKQCKLAYEASRDVGGVRVYLHELFQNAFRATKLIRSHQKFSAGHVSVSAVAVELALKIFGDLSERKVLILGAGVMGKSVLKHLKSNGLQKIYVSSRTLERAKNLANEYGGEFIDFCYWKDHIVDMDIIISSTDSSDWLLTKKEVKEKIIHHERSLFLIDMAMPRDFDPAINELDHVYLYNMDDLQTITQENIEQKQEEVNRLTMIIEEVCQDYQYQMDGSFIQETVIGFRNHFEAVRKEEVNKFFNKNYFNEIDQQKIDYLTQKIINVLLHHPVTKIKDLGKDPLNLEKIQTIRDLLQEKKETYHEK